MKLFVLYKQIYHNPAFAFKKLLLVFTKKRQSVSFATLRYFCGWPYFRLYL